MRRRLLQGLVCASVMVGLSGRAMADSSDFLGGFVGGMIGAAIMQGANNQPQQSNAQPQRSGSNVSSAERARNAEVQNALNHFAFPVGKADGVLGPRSRAAIGEYQALLSFPVTGTLTELERQILLGAHQRALMGGAEVTRIVATDPRGIRGLLVAQRNSMVGGAPVDLAVSDYGGLPPEIAMAVDEVARNSGLEGSQLVQRAGFIQLADLNADGRTDYLLDTAVTGSGFWCTGEACAVRVFLSTPEGFRRNDFQVADPTPDAFVCLGDSCRLDDTGVTTTAGTAAPEPQAIEPELPGNGTVMAAVPAEPALPQFGAALVPAQQSFSGYCQMVAERTTGRGGVLQTVAALQDPSQALGEQFCRVAEAARMDGAALIPQVQGFTPEQIAEQCQSFAAALSERVALIAAGGRDNTLSSVQAWLATTGMPNDQLVATSRICLSVGYASDDSIMALGSALLIAGTGNMVYGELVGHHLAAGIGVTQDTGKAVEWFEAATKAVKAGQTPVFLPEDSDRMVLIGRAAAAVSGRSEAPPLLPVVPVAVPTTAQGTP